MKKPAFLDNLDTKLKGQPENVITFLLIGLAFTIVIIALKGSPTLKAATLAWVMLP
jgi:hypothetical protein